MTLTEKSAYLKGLMEGMKLDKETNEGKLLAAIVDLLGDMSQNVADLEDATLSICDELDDIEDDLDEIYDYLDDEDEDDEDEYDEDEDYDEDYYDEDEFDFEDSPIYEVTCKCGEVINFDDEILEKGSMNCPTCGEFLEFIVEDDEGEPLEF